MTPKEALELLKRKAHTYDDEYCLPRMDCKKELDDKTDEAYQRLLKALTELEKLKRYPTSDEVCEALSEYLGCDVKYNDYGFLMDKDTSIRDLANDKRFDLITLIGRFYEGVEKK